MHCCLQHKGALSPGKLPWIHLALGKKVSSLPLPWNVDWRKPAWQARAPLCSSM